MFYIFKCLNKPLQLQLQLHMSCPPTTHRKHMSCPPHYTS